MSQSAGHEYLRTHQISGDVLLIDIEQESKAIRRAVRCAAVGHAAKEHWSKTAFAVIALVYAGSSFGNTTPTDR
jgi:hypothetical protein